MSAILFLVVPYRKQVSGIQWYRTEALFEVLEGLEFQHFEIIDSMRKSFTNGHWDPAMGIERMDLIPRQDRSYTAHAVMKALINQFCQLLSH